MLRLMFLLGPLPCSSVTAPFQCASDAAWPKSKMEYGAADSGFKMKNSGQTLCIISNLCFGRIIPAFKPVLWDRHWCLRIQGYVLLPFQVPVPPSMTPANVHVITWNSSKTGGEIWHWVCWKSISRRYWRWKGTKSSANICGFFFNFFPLRQWRT